MYRFLEKPAYDVLSSGILVGCYDNTTITLQICMFYRVLWIKTRCSRSHEHSREDRALPSSLEWTSFLEEISELLHKCPFSFLAMAMFLDEIYRFLLESSRKCPAWEWKWLEPSREKVWNPPLTDSKYSSHHRFLLFFFRTNEYNFVECFSFFLSQMSQWKSKAHLLFTTSADPLNWWKREINVYRY